MNYLLDTNVISETFASKPNAQVQQWFYNIPNHLLYLSVLTIGEIRKGIEKVNDTKKKQKLVFWLENDLTHLFHNRIIPIALETADRWGRLLHQAKRPLPAIDSLLAATALHHDMTLVTRNIKDFIDCPGLELINPWDKN